MEAQMLVAELPVMSADATSMNWWDGDAECTIVMSEPRADKSLWRDYLRGAERSYRSHGVSAAFDAAAIQRAGDTTLFWALLDGAGRLLGGVRAVGPLWSPDDSHAVLEWAGQPGLAHVRKMIADRLPMGVVEVKSAWVTDDPDRSRHLTKPIARAGFHAMALLGIQFFMATSADHVLNRWRSSGGVVAPIRSTPYPDERYRTKMIWWDRLTFADHADHDQVVKILAEMDDVHRRSDSRILQHAL
jgi:hypothetical protein